MIKRQRLKRSRQSGQFVTTAALAWFAVSHTAVAADQVSNQVASCLDKMVDVYLSPLIQEEEPPARDPLKLGPPSVHLRLPRRQLRLDLLPNVYADTEDCTQKDFKGWRASYLRTSNLAHSLGLSYDQPRIQDGQFFFYAFDSERFAKLPQSLILVDDTADREGIALKGTWIVDPDYNGQNQNVQFCLVSQALNKSCYAAVGDSMSYLTGSTSIISKSFGSTTLGAPSTSVIKQITVADLDSYFALMRRIADAVVVGPAPAK